MAVLATIVVGGGLSLALLTSNHYVLGVIAAMFTFGLLDELS